MADVLERDAGFCSGGEDIEDIEAEDGIHSPTDASEDSVDVKVQAISFRNRNKRKCAEPRKLDSELPAKKRKLKTEPDVSAQNPFRPWSASPPPARTFDSRITFPLRSFEPSGIPSLAPQYLFPSGCPLPPQRLPSGPTGHQFPDPAHQEEPLSLVSKSKKDLDERITPPGAPPPRERPILLLSLKGDSPQDSRVPLLSPPSYPSEGRTNDRGSYPTNNPNLNAVKTNSDSKCKTEPKTKPEDLSVHSDNKFGIDSLLSCGKTGEGSPPSVAATATAATTGTTSTSKSSQGGQQRNYKNMTRERRIEANARERTRVHTISAAFDTLRHSIPAYSHNQKLSKLSVLRIACSYIMTLSRLAGYDYSKDQTAPDLSTCVDTVSRTIQTEGKIRKKRED